MDLRLAGIDLQALTESEEGLLTERLYQKKMLRYYETQLFVAAILAAGRIALGKGSGDSVEKVYKEYKNHLFPEIAEGLEEQVKKTEKLLKKEFNRGPMRVKALDYEGRKKKRR